MLRLSVFMLAITVMCIGTVATAQEVKVYWRCGDGHFHAVEQDAKLKGTAIKLYVNYSLTTENGMRYSPISKQATAQLPESVEKGSYIMLGNKGQWLMNCVGQVIEREHFKRAKLIFDVSKNAYGCPLIPKGCAAKDNDAVLLEDD